MWQRRPLQRQSFPRRASSWGLPLAWVVVFVQQLAPFLTRNTTNILVGLYVACVALDGTTRDLYLPSTVTGNYQPGLYAKCDQWALSGLNFISDAACAACSVFFLEGLKVAPAAYFVPLFILAVATHCVVEIKVGRLLDRLHGGRQGFAGRRFKEEAEFEIQKVTLMR